MSAASSIRNLTFYPVRDEPIDDAFLLGADKVVNTLFGFLTSESIISPLVISVVGEWGSGKTSLILTLKTKLQNSGVKTVFFDAWKYEYSSDPAAALVWDIAKQLTLGKTKFNTRAKQVGKLALDAFSRKTVNIPLKEVASYFQSSIKGVDDLSDKLEKLVSDAVGSEEKIVVFIDDLDRCSLENVIRVLEALKLFLNIPNFIFMIAVDIDKLKLAWSAKYGRTEGTGSEGSKYLEKIIQIQVGLPQPSRKQIQEYVAALFPTMPAEVVELISLTELDNPRRIKRLLNLISLRCNIEGESVGKKEAALLWTVLEAMGWSYSNGSYIAHLYEQYNAAFGRTGFYDIIFEIASRNRDEFQREYNNIEKFKIMAQTRSNPTIIHRYMTIVSKMIKEIDKEKMLTSLAEVVSFANVRRSAY